MIVERVVEREERVGETSKGEKPRTDVRLIGQLSLSLFF